MEPLSAQEDPIQAAETRLSAPGPLGGLESEGSSRVSPPSERLRSVARPRDEGDALWRCPARNEPPR